MITAFCCYCYNVRRLCILEKRSHRSQTEIMSLEWRMNLFWCLKMLSQWHGKNWGEIFLAKTKLAKGNDVRENNNIIMCYVLISRNDFDNKMLISDWFIACFCFISGIILFYCIKDTNICIDCDFTWSYSCLSRFGSSGKNLILELKLEKWSKLQSNDKLLNSIEII